METYVHASHLLHVYNVRMQLSRAKIGTGTHPEMNIAHCSFVKLPNIVKSDLEDWSASFFGMRFRRK